MWSWADRAIKIQHLDPVNKNITLASKTQFGLRPGMRYHYLLLFEFSTKTLQSSYLRRKSNAMIRVFR